MHEPNVIVLLQLLVHLSHFDDNMNYEFTKNFIFILLRKELEIADYEKYLEAFNFYYRKESESVQTDQSFEKLNKLCKELTEGLPIRQRIIIILYLLKFNKLFKNSSLIDKRDNTDLDKAIRLISMHFKISPDDIDSLNAFINNEIHNVTKKDNLIITGKSKFLSDIKFLERKHLNGLIKFYYVGSLNIFIFYLQGSDELRLNSLEIIPYSLYFFTKSSLIVGNGIASICFNDLLKLLLFKRDEPKIRITATDVSFNYRNSENGLKQFRFYAESGQFIAVLGKSGSGKSTLMRLLTGNLKPTSGDIKINGVSLFEKRNQFNNIIGYVPQYDTLICELTAYQNLYFYTKLWDNALSKQEIDNKINILLADLELENIKDRIVGTEYQKCISGGERKRLNLALELIRDPKVLFADEPTSGLSSSDSETLMRLLQEQVLNGRLVIINIHQPSSAVFKSFDKVFILDSGGYPVYFGNPLLVSDTLTGQANAQNNHTSECTSCGNINAEGIFQLLEEKKVDRFGVYTHERKIQPKIWYSYFVNRNSEAFTEFECSIKLPETILVRKNYILQLLVFLKRNILIKKNDIQYLAVTLLTTPALAVVLSFLCRNSSNETGGYAVYFNENIPSFLFISVLVALFSGLLSGAEEIYGDRLVNVRESILKLSRNSYLLSKATLLFFISAVQMLLYVSISNAILEIHGMILEYWLILWVLSCSANLIGLILSAIFKSVVSIYIFIPIILIPQILLSGTVIKYKNINQSVSSIKHVPLIGDLMPSRWAFEALAVSQFKSNKTETGIFNDDMIISNNSYLSYYLIPDMVQHIENAKLCLGKGSKLLNADSLYITSGLKIVNHWSEIERQTAINITGITNDNLLSLRSALLNKQHMLLKEIEKVQAKKDAVLKKATANKDIFADSIGNMYYNNASLTKILLNVNEIQPYKKIDGEYIRLFEPIYNIPSDKFGKAHLFAPFKRIGGFYINTNRFNLVIMSLMCLFLYIMLLAIHSYKLNHNNILMISK